MKHRRYLFEMFMPEARFPDEKFWQKDGTPIYPEPKGPPRGTVGKTHADLGADKDHQDQDPADDYRRVPLDFEQVKKLHPKAAKSLNRPEPSWGRPAIDPDTAEFFEIDGDVDGELWVYPKGGDDGWFWNSETERWEQ